MRPAIEAGAERAGRPAAEVEVSDWVVVAISDDPVRARRDAARQIAFHATVRTYDRVLDLHGFGDTAAEIRSLWRRYDLDGMTDLVTDEMLETMAVAGTAGECRDRIADRAGHADRLLLGAPVVATDPELLRDYHQAILDAFGPSRA
jgi:alkanesulfonate monooxygenase SsuD/methylene tetrahydromethanopterin reductase-like flavin-dependent oxidoreductase (luciferase family)